MSTFTLALIAVAVYILAAPVVGLVLGRFLSSGSDEPRVTITLDPITLDPSRETPHARRHRIDRPRRRSTQPGL